jgi:hypothetical protein
MIRFATVILSLAAVSLLSSLPQLKGRARVLVLSSLEPEDLMQSSLSMEEQRQQLLRFEAELCRSMELCQNVTRSAQPEVIVTTCQQSAQQMRDLLIPLALPEGVRDHLELYRTSQSHKAALLARRWWSPRLSIPLEIEIHHFNSYEIEVTGYQSVPQKIRRLYGLDSQARAKFVHCQEIQQLSEAYLAPELRAEVTQR